MPPKRARRLAAPPLAADGRRRQRQLKPGVPAGPVVETKSRKRCLQWEAAWEQSLEAPMKKQKRPEAKTGEGLEADLGTSTEEASEEGSSEPGGILLKGHKTRMLRARRASAREKVLSRVRMLAEAKGTTCLEQMAVTERTRERYSEFLDRFLSFAGWDFKALRQQPASLVDSQLCQHFDNLYSQGHQGSVGEQTIAALMDGVPEFGRLGDKKLARAWRSLRGWRRLTPSRRRKALALGVWAAVCWRLAAKHHLKKAMFVLLGLSTYARPSSLLACRRCDLVAPQKGVSPCWSLLRNPAELDVPSKTGRFDEGSMLDSSYLKGLEPVMEKMADRHSTANLWGFSYGELVRELEHACMELGVEKASPYQLRHSGATVDVGRRWRQLDEVQKRGAWEQRKSMNRYEHSCRMTYDYASYDLEQKSWFETAEKELARMMLGKGHSLVNVVPRRKGIVRAGGGRRGAARPSAMA